MGDRLGKYYPLDAIARAAEMMPEALNAVRDFISVFEKVYKVDPQQGRISLVSVFATCFGLLTPEDRLKSLDAILSVAKDINVVLFEDGQDFVTYLQEKSIEHQQELERFGEQDDKIG